MKNYIIPTTVVDDFFDNPMKVREFALQQEFKTDPHNLWPGKRTALLNDIDPALLNHIIMRSLSVFYDFHHTHTEVKWHATAGFQMVDRRYNQGWVHKDLDKITGIIYLDPESDLDSGTTIWESNKEATELLNHKEKMQSFMDPDSADAFEKFRKENNDQFTKSITVKNKFNRLVMFDSHLYHAADDYHGIEDTGRLTLVFFIDGLFVPDYPLQRLKKV